MKRFRVRLRKPWYTPNKFEPNKFELEMTIPLNTTEAHLLAGDMLTLTFGESKTVHWIELTAPRMVAFRSGDRATVRGQVDGIDCHFTRTEPINGRNGDA